MSIHRLVNMLSGLFNGRGGGFVNEQYHMPFVDLSNVNGHKCMFFVLILGKLSPIS